MTEFFKELLIGIKSRFVLILAALTLTILSPVMSAESPSPSFDQEFADAYSVFVDGVEGDEDAVVRAIRAFRGLFERHPNRWEAYAFYGSACTLRARDVIFFKKMDYVREGFGAMDKAVQQAPDCSWTRLVRAINSYQVPRFLDRRDLAREDFDFLIQEVPSTSAKLPLAETLQQLTFYHAGLFAYEEHDARAIDWLRVAAGIENGPIPKRDLDQALQRAMKRFET